MGDYNEWIVNNMYVRMEPHINRNAIPTSFISPPPAQDSPNHILNALNDKCIQRILTYLIGDTRDFFAAAEVCTKFQENAKKCFPSIYMDFYVGYGTPLFHHLPLRRTKSFLSIFAHLIKSIHWPATLLDKYDSEIFNAIGEFCGKNLINLCIRTRKLDFSIGLQFEALEELTFFQCTINNFIVPPSLKKLIFQGSAIKMNSLEWMSQKHRDLIEIKFYGFTQLNDGIITEFQAMNPQLQVFHAYNCENVTSSIFRGISVRLPSLVDLELIPHWECRNPVKLEEDAMHLCGLKHLKRLYGILSHQNTSRSFVDALVDNCKLIEDLQIFGLIPGVVESLTRLTRLKTLKLYKFVFEAVKDLAMKIQSLQHLRIYTCPRITLSGIIEILQLATNLKELAIEDSHMLIDSNQSIESILNLARGRVQIKLNVKRDNVRIPLEPYEQRRLSADFQWLNIRDFLA